MRDGLLNWTQAKALMLEGVLVFSTDLDIKEPEKAFATYVNTEAGTQFWIHTQGHWYQLNDEGVNQKAQWQICGDVLTGAQAIVAGRHFCLIQNVSMPDRYFSADYNGQWRVTFVDKAGNYVSSEPIHITNLGDDVSWIVVNHKRESFMVEGDPADLEHVSVQLGRMCVRQYQRQQEGA